MGAVRLFLAYVVACGHWSALYARPAGIEFDSWAPLGFDAGYAVFFFYAISGFLITYALSTNYGPGEVRKFYANRVIRIFSVYWPVAVIIFLMYPQAWQKFSSANLLDQSTALFLFGLDWNVSFGQPGGQYFGGAISLMHQAWTTNISNVSVLEQDGTTFVCEPEVTAEVALDVEVEVEENDYDGSRRIELHRTSLTKTEYFYPEVIVRFDRTTAELEIVSVSFGPQSIDVGPDDL